MCKGYSVYLYLFIDVSANNKLMKMEGWENLIPAIAIFSDPFVQGIGDCDG